MSGYLGSDRANVDLAGPADGSRLLRVHPRPASPYPSSSPYPHERSTGRGTLGLVAVGAAPVLSGAASTIPERLLTAQ
jgi:hypothetical protein